MALENTVLVYEMTSGKRPFVEWLEGFRSADMVGRIQARLDRVRHGNFGDTKALGDGIYELRLDFGKGYRIYFGQRGDAIVILLCGGDKSSQIRDIKRAKEYWTDFLRREQ